MLDRGTGCQCSTACSILQSCLHHLPARLHHPSAQLQHPLSWLTRSQGSPRALLQPGLSRADFSLPIWLLPLPIPAPYGSFCSLSSLEKSPVPGGGGRILQGCAVSQCWRGWGGQKEQRGQRETGGTQAELCQPSPENLPEIFEHWQPNKTSPFANYTISIQHHSGSGVRLRNHTHPPSAAPHRSTSGPRTPPLSTGPGYPPTFLSAH